MLNYHSPIPLLSHLTFLPKNTAFINNFVPPNHIARKFGFSEILITLPLPIELTTTAAELLIFSKFCLLTQPDCSGLSTNLNGVAYGLDDGSMKILLLLNRLIRSLS